MASTFWGAKTLNLLGAKTQWSAGPGSPDTVVDKLIMPRRPPERGDGRAPRSESASRGVSASAGVGPAEAADGGPQLVERVVALDPEQLLLERLDRFLGAAARRLC